MTGQTDDKEVIPMCPYCTKTTDTWTVKKDA